MQIFKKWPCGTFLFLLQSIFRGHAQLKVLHVSQSDKMLIFWSILVKKKLGGINSLIEPQKCSISEIHYFLRHRKKPGVSL